MHRDLRSERGATAVLIAFSMVGLLAFGGLVIDGGDAFAQRRQMQNSADSSATSGANALYLAKAGEGPVSDIYTKAQEDAEANGAESFECDLVHFNSAGDELPNPTPCQDATTTADIADVWKVRVRVNSDHQTQLVSVIGIDSFTARAQAAASLLAGTTTVGTAPFAICASPTVVGHPEPLLIETPTGYAINPDAVGHQYDLWGNDIKEKGSGRDCGDTSNSFRGLVQRGTYDVPGWWGIDTGNEAQIKDSPLVGDDCINTKFIKDIPLGCQFAVPLCIYVSSEHTSGTKVEIRCVTFGRFEVAKNVDQGKKDLEVTFLGGGLLASGEGSGIPVPGGPTVIKLSKYEQ